MCSLIHQYQALNAQKQSLCEQLDTVEDAFIRAETALYKEHMLALYKKMAPHKAPALEQILGHISYGPVKIASLPLIDGCYQRFGSALYYKYRDPATNFESPVLYITYKSPKGQTIRRAYGLVLYNQLPAPVSAAIPAYWFSGMGVVELGSGPQHSLIEFLAVDADLGECGDLYGAIPDYYDIQEKLTTGLDYYWTAPKSLVGEMRDVSEQILTLAMQDATENDWEKLQNIFQKAFVALSYNQAV
jgi:hypothetical protein